MINNLKTKQQPHTLPEPLNKALVLGLTISLLISLPPTQAQNNIAKCQDGTGQWYYGDLKNAPCTDKRPISILNAQGATVEQQLPIKKREARLSSEQKQLLKRYASVKQISAERQNKLKQLERMSQFSQRMHAELLEDIKTLKANPSTTKSQEFIQIREAAALSYEKELDLLHQQQQEINTRYDKRIEAFQSAQQHRLSNTQPLTR